MNNVYLLSLVDEEDVISFVFKSKDNASKYIETSFSDYKKIAEDKDKGVECWRKHTGNCILLEKLKIED